MLWLERLFPCRGCAAREEEIKHLLSVVSSAQAAADKAQARICEMIAPGTRQRVEPPPGRPLFRGPRPVTPGVATESLPGYERDPDRPGVELEG